MWKKGMLSSVVIFLILNVVFFAAMLFFIAWAGTNVSVKEQIYAKEIALLIDQAKPGTTIIMNISELYNLAEKNNYKEIPFNINYEENKITVRLIEGKGYSYYYFTRLESESVSIDKNKLLRIKV